MPNAQMKFIDLDTGCLQPHFELLDSAHILKGTIRRDRGDLAVLVSPKIIICTSTDLPKRTGWLGYQFGLHTYGEVASDS